MPFDLVAFYESQDADALTAVAACADEVYKISADDLTVKKKAPFLAGSLHAAISQATMMYHEFRQPSLKVPYRFYKTVDANDAFMGEGFNNLLGSPLPLYAGEKLNVYVISTTDEVDMVFAWLASGPAKLSDMENVRPTHSITGLSTTDPTAGTWSTLPITWDQSLPRGRYAVIGMQVGVYKASGPVYGGARLIFLETTWRPGVIVRGGEGAYLGMASIHPALLYGERWPLMNEISFDHDEMPDMEVMEGAANEEHSIELLLQKIA